MQERNAGIDFLRIFSMYLVVVLHLLGHGGMLFEADWMSEQSNAGWLLETVAYCAVNCFALISGYVGVTAGFKWSRLAKLYCNTAFYTIPFGLLLFLIAPAGVQPLSWTDAVFPITTCQYWYITAYAGMFLFIPFMNAAVEHTGKNAAVGFVVAVFVLYCALPCILKQSPYEVCAGYSSVWLAVMYMFGGLIRKYDFSRHIRIPYAAALFISSTLIAWGCKILLHPQTYKVHFSGGNVPVDGFINYASPFILINGIALFCLFANLQITSERVKKMIALCSPGVLCVYIMHTHPLIWDTLILDSTRWLASYSAYVIVPAILVFSAALYGICTYVDFVRIRFFKAVQMQKFFKKIDALLPA